MATSVPTIASRCYDERVETTPLTTTPLFAFAITFALHVVALALYPRIGLLDFPERYGLTRKRLPYPTGTISALCCCGFLLGTQVWTLQLFGVISSIFALSTVCFIDDRARISPLVRLVTHVVVGFTIFVTGTRIYSLTNPLADIGFGDVLKLDAWTLVFPDIGPLPIVSGLFTIAWILFTVNALNWFDGIPGQTSVISTIGFATIGFLSLSDRVDQPEVALIAFVLSGIAGASAVFELPLPMQRIVPGDSGAMFYGLLLGVLTIYAGGKVATGFLVLGIPLIDSLIVIIRRLYAGKNPMKGSGSGEHLHHLLLARGWSTWSIIALTTGIGAAFGLTALFLSTLGKFLAGLILTALATTLSFWAGATTKNR